MFKKKEPGTFCPLIKKECVEDACVWWVQVRGTDPQTGGDIDHYSCAVAWMPLLQIESSQQTRQAGAAIESLRNNVDKEQQQMKTLLGLTSRTQQ
jgi:hypothetical protein